MKCGVVVLVMVAAGAGIAQASPIRLVTASDACNLDALEPQVTALAGSDAVDATATSSARVDVSRVRGSYRAEIMFDDGNGEVRGPRIVTAATCGELVASTALVIAMALPDLAPPRPAADAPPPVSVEPSAPVVVAAEPVPEVARPMSIRAVHEHIAPVPAAAWALVLGGGVGLTSRGGEAGLVVGTRVRRGALSLGAELRADAPQALDVGDMARIAVLRAQISITPCLHRGAVAGCVLASVGTLRGAGDGLLGARSVYTPLLAGGARVAWEHAFSDRVGLRVTVDVDALATTTRFDVDRMTVWVSPRFEAGTGIGIVAQFP